MTPAQVEALIERLRIWGRGADNEADQDYNEAASALAALRDEIKALDPDPVVCGCREAGCPHTPIAKLPRQALVDHYKEHIRTVEADRAALRDENAALRQDAEKLTNDVRWIHQKLKRGERTQDHGLKGNLACIIDHLAEEGLT